jgi:peptidoglycan/LPS O-acetylase OafA/YrhL
MDFMQAAQARLSNGKTETKTFRRDIEGLRAVAVIAVAAFHFGVPGIPGGFTGVDIFFVISGYLITGLLIRELETSGQIDLLAFYGRRARRLLPAVLLMTLATLVAIPFVLAPSEQFRFAEAAAATSVYASNILFLRQALDYFAPLNASNPFLHTWSLAVEEQFYLVWPALLLLVSRRQIRPIRLAVTIASVTLVSFALCLWLTRFDQPWAFFASPARAWEFGIGGLAALAWVTGWARRFKIVPALGWIAAGALLVSFAFISEASNFPGWIALLPVAATACVLVSGAAQSEQGPARILRTAPFQWIGRRSYSIYLWHWPIIALAGALYPSLSAASRLACGALTLAFAAASYQWLEAPIRSHPWLATRASRPVCLGICLTVIGATAAIGAAALARHFEESPAQIAVANATRPGSLAAQHGCLDSDKVTKPVPCVFGAASSSVTVALLGDSHAAQWSGPLAQIGRAERWRLVTYLKGGCAVANVPVYNPRLHRISDECAAWRANAIDAIVRLHPAFVVVGEFSSQYFAGPHFRHGDSVTMANWAAGMQRSLRELSRAGSPIVLLRDSPTPLGDMRICIENAQWRGSSQSCDIPRSLAVDPALTRTESQLAAATPGVRFVDLTSQFCNETTCPAWRNGLVIYRDRSHMTNRFAASLAPPLEAALLDLLHPGENRP